MLISADIHQGVCGLHNLGNTCFMNAGLQCLLSNTHLVQHFLGRIDSDDCKCPQMCYFNGEPVNLNPISYNRNLGSLTAVVDY